METWREELHHHGILGQKWGKKNGPPYPINSSNHSASEKKAGWKKSLNDSRKVKNKKQNKSVIKSNKTNSGNSFIKEMDDNELQKRLKRIQMERLYKEELKKANTKEGKQYVQKLVKTGATIASLTSTAITIYNNMEKISKIIDKNSSKT